MKGKVFNRKGQTPEDIEIGRLRRALARGPAENFHFLFELIELSRLLRPGSKSDEMTSFSHEMISLFQAFQEEGVRYLLVGGFAVNAHGHSRATGDLDLWVEDTPANRDRLVSACKKMSIGGAEHLRTMDWAPGWSGFRLPSGFEVEIMGSIAGFPANSFDECAGRAEVVHLKDVELPILHLDDLITAKAALRRPKDEEDLRQLERIKDLREK